MIMNGVTPANSIWFKAQPDGIDDLAELTEGEDSDIYWYEGLSEDLPQAVAQSLKEVP